MLFEEGPCFALPIAAAVKDFEEEHPFSVAEAAAEGGCYSAAAFVLPSLLPAVDPCVDGLLPGSAEECPGVPSSLHQRGLPCSFVDSGPVDVQCVKASCLWQPAVFVAAGPSSFGHQRLAGSSLRSPLQQVVVLRRAAAAVGQAGPVADPSQQSGHLSAAAVGGGVGQWCQCQVYHATGAAERSQVVSQCKMTEGWGSAEGCSQLHSAAEGPFAAGVEESS